MNHYDDDLYARLRRMLWIGFLTGVILGVFGLLALIGVSTWAWGIEHKPTPITSVRL